VRRCDRERIDPPWPAARADANARWNGDPGEKGGAVASGDVLAREPLLSRELLARTARHVFRLTHRMVHLREPVALPSPAEAAPAAAERGR